jgi:hypothetical protein
MRLLLNIIISSCGLIALALAVGLLRPGLTQATLQAHAERSVARCMQQDGFGRDRTLAIEQELSPRDRALERCWSDAAHDPQFERLALTDPIATRTRWRVQGFRTWRCVERAGYVRATDIPLSGPGGHPLQVAAGNFRVGSSDRAIEHFYRAAASCSGESVEAYRLPDGSFSTKPSDGRTCIRHEHHAHGCYGAATYPDPSAGSEPR